MLIMNNAFPIPCLVQYCNCLHNLKYIKINCDAKKPIICHDTNAY